MTERPDPSRTGHHSDNVDPDDPTGVRSILSSLKDPGPMPADLVARITASLAEEQARREREPHVATVYSLSDAGARRRSGTRLPMIAMAASIVVLAGAAVMGMLALNQGLLSAGGADTSAAASSTRADSGAEAGGLAAESDDSAADDGSADDRAGGDTAGGSATPEALDSDGEEAAEAAEDSAEQYDTMTTLAGPVVQASGILVTAASLHGTVVELRARAPLGTDDQARDALERGSVGTVSGASDCLSELLALDPAEIEPRIDVIDAVRFEGDLRAILVLTDGPAVLAAPDEPATAYLVNLDCRPGAATLLHEPVRVP